MSSNLGTPPTRYQFLRDRLSWNATLTGLETDRDGTLRLARVAGPSDGTPVVLPIPYDLGVSGIAAGPCEAVFVSDTEQDHVVFVDGLCVSRANVCGLRKPRGLAVTKHGIWVADSGNARVRRLAFPALEPNLDIEAGLVRPASIACDDRARVYVIDAGRNAVRRFGPHGVPDHAYDAAIAATNSLTSPLFLAVARGNVVFVSDAAHNSVTMFDDTGAQTGRLAAPVSGWRPGAIAASASEVFIADRQSGRLDVFLADGTWWCGLPDFQGPVTALAVDPANGDLLIKTGLDDGYVRFAAGRSYAAAGQLHGGPFDAGEKLDWFRAACAAQVPAGSSIVFEIAQRAAAAPAPAPADWRTAPSLDLLLATIAPDSVPGSRRFIWLRATLATTDPRVSPALSDVRAETTGEDYRAYLPAMYSRDDEPAEFLFRFLALARTELAAVEEHIDALPQLLSPQFAPASQLEWLADWLALDLPRNMDDAGRRSLIERAASIWRHRGTPAGICELVEIATGVRPTIIESYGERGLWVLEASSRLGFDTGLPAIEPLGMIVPDAVNPLSLGSGCAATVVGSAVVGESGPLPVEDIGEPLFTDAAHRFTVFMPAYQAADAALLDEVRRVLDTEKPAHTGYDLCLVHPDFRVGFQATVGIDTVVGGPPYPMRLGEAVLDRAASLSAPMGDADRVGQGVRLDGSATLR
jgi:phage tail-like protein